MNAPAAHIAALEPDTQRYTPGQCRPGTGHPARRLPANTHAPYRAIPEPDAQHGTHWMSAHTSPPRPRHPHPLTRTKEYVTCPVAVRSR